MSREVLQYSVVGLGVLVVTIVAGLYLWPGERLEPPDVLERRVMEADSAAQQKEAAEQLLRHGPKARQEVRRVLSGYQQDDTEVKLALIKAAQNIRDWRSMPELLRLMEDPDPRIRGRANAAAVEILGADFLFRADDPPHLRAQNLTRMRQSFEARRQNLQNFYVDQPE